jgi:hypothetical protein
MVFTNSALAEPPSRTYASAVTHSAPTTLQSVRARTANTTTLVKPLGKLPVIRTPFDTVCLDIVGPITPVSDKGNRYILMSICIAIRYPDAIALKNIDTVTVADALIEMYIVVVWDFLEEFILIVAGSSHRN